ncbi:Ppx/GppA family phosphatase [Aerococcaceae bacterium INB8]|uniref:Ppx/GppA family phosphatase n=1 Tax=Ruoffia halotolerans TaxID=2748684 RepID=A0A839A7V8_9LACT|nr:Ppx/GppA family phosphatase [Ruoffia halotolerans]MBA5730157.1 Ppx/GppA family phosphatase [Ruoffia halotolerans]
MYKEVIGVIDIGSNTIRLVIFGLDEQYNYIEIQNIKTPARLSQYLITDKDGENPQMAQDGIDKLIETLISFKAVAESFNVAQILPMATAAVRQSVNKADILEQVKEATGLDINLVSEEEEASYGQYAITHSTVVNDAITIDIGGGSCEITYYEDKNMVQYHSFPFGAVSLSRQFFQDKDHNDPNAIEAVQEYVRKQFKQFDWIKKAKLPIVAIGGSARNIANVHQRLVDYQMAGVHGYSMDEDDIEETLNLFISTDIDDMADIEGLSADRKDLIIPANIVFLELFKVVKAKTFQLSSQGLREGIILKYINQTYNSPLDNQLIRVRSIRQVVRDFPINTVGSQIIVDIIISLYQQLCNLGLLTYSYETQEEIEFAAYIYRFGGFISPEADSQHTFYLLSNMNLMGFSHPKRLRLALLASYRNRSLFKQYLTNYENWLTDDEISDLEVLGGVLKFSSALNDSKTGPIEDLKLYRTKDNNYKLDIYHSAPVIAEKYRSMRHAKHFERALDGDLEIEFIQK